MKLWRSIAGNSESLMGLSKAVLMASDVNDAQVNTSTESVEIKLQGEGPWSLGPDSELIFTPGHTEVLHN